MHWQNDKEITPEKIKEWSTELGNNNWLVLLAKEQLKLNHFYNDYEPRVYNPCPTCGK